MSSAADAAIDRMHRYNRWFHPASTGELPATGVRGVRVTGYLKDESGWGAAGRGYVHALQYLQVPMAVHDVSSLTVNRSEDHSIPPSPVNAETDVNLVCVDAGQHFALLSHVGESFFANHYNVGAWAWELPRFPESWYNRFAYYDEIWVGTSFIASSLAPIAPVPVIRIPPAITDAPASRKRGRHLLRARGDEFIFLFVFDVHSHLPRKNPHAAIAAFRQAFAPTDEVRLVLKSVNADADAPGIAALRELAGDARIDFIDGYWPREDVRDLMAGCDAYVSLHRAEGTGLTIAEAMALGRPVIATDWSGNTDFANASNSFPVSYSPTRVQRNVGPYKAGETWAEPDVDHAAEQMRFVARHRAIAAQRGLTAREDMRRDYSVEAVAALVRSRLDVIGSRHRLTTLRSEVSAFVSGYRGLVDEIRAIASRVVPPRHVVAVVSRGDEELIALPALDAWHFPEARPGVYAGHHPSDSGEAIAALEAARSRGAEFLLFPGTAFWWFDHYDGLRCHLYERYGCLWFDERCAIYDLRAAAGASV